MSSQPSVPGENPLGNGARPVETPLMVVPVMVRLVFVVRIPPPLPLINVEPNRDTGSRLIRLMDSASMDLGPGEVGAENVRKELKSQSHSPAMNRWQKMYKMKQIPNDSPYRYWHQ